MNPEQWLLIVQEYFSIKFNIIFFATFVRVLCPERMNVVDRNRALLDFDFLFRRRDFYHLFFTLLVFFFFRLGIFVNVLYDNVRIFQFTLVNSLIFDWGIGLFQINLHRHERTVFLQNFSCPVFVRKL